MADRRVKATQKNADGDILGLCNTGQAWSPRSKQGAISDIETGAHTYHVMWVGNQRTEIRVVNGPTGKYLRTDRDNTSKNNLDDLPNC